MSIGITILTGSNAPVMTEQVKIYLCVGYTEKKEFSFIGELNAVLNASGTPTARPMSEPI